MKLCTSSHAFADDDLSRRRLLATSARPVARRLTFGPRCETGGFDIVEAEKRWDEVAVAIRIVRNAASTHIANRLREVYREYLEKYAQAVEQVVHGLPRSMCLKFKCVISSWETGQPLYAGGATHPE